MKLQPKTQQVSHLTPPTLAPRWTAAQRKRAYERISPLWREAAQTCPGRFALALLPGQSELLVHLRSAQAVPTRKLWTLALFPDPQRDAVADDSVAKAVIEARASGGVVSELTHWPIQPASIDTVFCLLSPAMLAQLPAVLREIDICLAADGRIVFCVENAGLSCWCRVGMPLCRSLGWAMRSAEWGDARRLTPLPRRWSRQWSETLQQWLPGVAEWSVQSWQKETLCQASQPPLRLRQLEPRWAGEWVPQSRAAGKVRLRSNIRK